MADIQYPSIFGSYLQGQNAGNQQRQLRETRADDATLRGLAPSIINGDPAAFSQAAAIDPKAAGQFQDAGDSQLRRLKGAISYIEQAEKTGNPQAVEAAYRQVRPYLSRTSPAGIEPPETWAEAKPRMLEAKAQIAMLDSATPQGAVQSTFIDNQGNRVAIMRDGSTQILGQNAPNNQIIDTGNGFVGVNKGNLQAAPVVLGGAPQAAAPNSPAVSGASPAEDAVTSAANVMIANGVPEAQVDAWVQTQLSQPVTASVPQGNSLQTGTQLRSSMKPAEEQRLSLAQEANQRAAEAAQRAEQAAQNAQRGNAPTGFRFKADGSLEPIPGGPKPAGAAATEGERKAATLLARLTGSQAQLEQAVNDDPSAASPNLLAAGVGAVFGDTAANAITPADRQRVEAAQLDILDAALTLGTGAAYTREQLQGYRRSYFPQIGDSQGTIADKAERLQNVIEAAKIAAGRAGPQANAQQLAPSVQARPAASAERRARNPQTGEVLVLRNGQWVPE